MGKHAKHEKFTTKNMRKNIKNEKRGKMKKWKHEDKMGKIEKRRQ